MAITITNNKIINLTLNTKFKIKLKAKGGTKPYSWSTKSTLPNKIKLTSKGALRGIPKEIGTFKKIKIKAVDNNGISVTKRFKIIVESVAPNTTTTTTAAPLGSGTLWLWGDNSSLALGDNSGLPKSSPVQTAAFGNNWKELSLSGLHGMAIKTDGTLWTWGTNAYGLLGDNTTVAGRLSPVQTITGGTNWESASSGAIHSGAIKTDGTLWLWGYNVYGQLGDNTITNRSSPVQTVCGGTNWKQVSCGGYHTAAIKTDGTLWLWGNNTFGGLGDNTIINRSSPIQTIVGGSNWKQVCASSGYYTLAIKTDGTLWAWGANGGNLGDNTIINRSSPVQVVSGGTNWKQVSGSGNFFSAATKTDGTLWCWGLNTHGTLGDNTTVNKSSPVQIIGGGTNWSEVYCGGGSVIAIKTDGTVWNWGNNGSGQLGDNTTVKKSSPVQTIANGNNWIKVNSNGGGVAGAIKEN